jgi:hypothetical protein
VVQAIATMQPGDVAIVFTPDDTHLEIATACIQHGLHVLVAKPIVKTLKEHLQLLDLAAEHKVMVREYCCASGSCCHLLHRSHKEFSLCYNIISHSWGPHWQTTFIRSLLLFSATA